MNSLILKICFKKNPSFWQKEEFSKSYFLLHFYAKVGPIFLWKQVHSYLKICFFYVLDVSLFQFCWHSKLTELTKAVTLYLYISRQLRRAKYILFCFIIISAMKGSIGENESKQRKNTWNRSGMIWAFSFLFKIVVSPENNIHHQSSANQNNLLFH